MKITVPPWRASRNTLMTRFIMRCVILCGSEGSSGAHLSLESSRARLRASLCRSTSFSRSPENCPGSHSDSKGSIRDPESLPPWSLPTSSWPLSASMLPVAPYPDQRPLRVGSHREPPEFPRFEGERAGKLEPLQILGWPPLGGKERGLSEDGTEDDRALLLAQHARLVAGGEEALQRRGVGQRVDAIMGFRHVPPSVPHELG